MGTRQSEQASLWIATTELPKSPGHPFYTRLNALLDAADFDRVVEGSGAEPALAKVSQLASVGSCCTPISSPVREA